MIAIIASSTVLAEQPTAPAAVQAEILTRILPYERAFESRVKGRVVVALVQKPGDAESASSVQQMRKALSDIGTVRNHPLSTVVLTYAGAAKLSADCRSEGANVVFLSPGMAGETGAIGNSLTGSGILSFAAVEFYVPGGIVLGVAVVDGKPRISINLAQAKAQAVEFPASILKLAKVY